MQNIISWKMLAVTALTASLVICADVRPVLAATAGAAPTLVLADAGAADAKSADPNDVTIAPMPDAAVAGAACLGTATAALASAYAIGPTEIMMMISGAVIAPSTSPLLFIPLGSILAGGTCALGTAAAPVVQWAVEQSDNIGAQFSSLSDTWFTTNPLAGAVADAGANDANKDAPGTVRAMNEGEVQASGCVVGVLGALGAAFVSSPSEVLMLAAGGVTSASTTPILMMGLLGTLIPSSCAVGASASLPVLAFFNNFSAISDSIAQSTGQAAQMVAQAAGRMGGGLVQWASGFGAGMSQTVAALGAGKPSLLQVADGTPTAR